MSRHLQALRPDIETLYFDELYRVSGGRKGVRTYKKLLHKLHEVPFTYTILMDENRFADGISLRYIVGRELGYSDPEIATGLDNKPCSVLEMLVALCLGIEERIMCDPELGDRTSEWFWLIMKNLKLDRYSDSYYNKYSEINIDDILNAFMDRKYHRDGSNGGAFIIPGCEYDLRNTELWYQACWYLNTIIDREDFLNEG